MVALLKSKDPSSAGSQGAVRIDRWLLAARLFKTRSQAAAACSGGKVEVEGVTAKAHRLVRVGDTVTVKPPPRFRVLLVAGVAQKRLSAADARSLYVDKSPALPPRQVALAADACRNPGSGRPTKRERRATDRLRTR